MLTRMLTHLNRGILPVACALTMTPAWADLITDDIFPGEWLLDTKLDYSKEVLNQQQTIVNKSQFILESYRDGLLETGKIYLSGHAVYSH